MIWRHSNIAMLKIATHVNDKELIMILEKIKNGL